MSEPTMVHPDGLPAGFISEEAKLLGEEYKYFRTNVVKPLDAGGPGTDTAAHVARELTLTAHNARQERIRREALRREPSSWGTLPFPGHPAWRPYAQPVQISPAVLQAAINALVDKVPTDADMSARWAEIWGEPSSPETQAKIRRTAAWLLGLLPKTEAPNTAED